jgi:hypothetical protein
MNLEEFFDRAGWITLALAVGLQMGLLIGAETTPVQLLSDVRTPGLIGPSVGVTPLYRLWWQAATALSIAGLMFVAAARFEDFVYWVIRKELENNLPDLPEGPDDDDQRHGLPDEEADVEPEALGDQGG